MSYISHEDYKKLMTQFQKETPKGMLKEALDPVGKEDSDIDNDGDVDKTDKYLLKRRKAVGKAIGKGRMMKEDEVEEYGYADNYPGSWGYKEGKEDDVEEGLHMPPLQATGPTIDTVEEDHMENPFRLPKRTDTSKLDYDPDASRFEPDYMKTPGEDDDDEDEFEFDDEDDIISASDDIPTSFKRAVAGDRDRYPFLRENTVANPPFGFDVLSPDETKQLKEYIESVKTIQKEIAKLTAKAGKKVKVEGGDMTGLTMTSSTVSEKKEESKKEHENPAIENIEKKIPEKLYNIFKKAIKQLRKRDLTKAEMKMWFNHELEEAGKEAIMGQHD